MLFTTPIYIAATTTWLPPERSTAADAVADGRLDPVDAARDGYIELSVSPTLAPAQMAVLAAQRALTTSETDPADVGLVAHAWIYHQGHDFWSPAHYIAHHTGMWHAIPVGIQQMCNGGAIAIETAATRLIADPRTSTALVTTADRFEPPGFNRWTGDYGIGYGDGATAVLLSTKPARYRLLASVTVGAPELEQMHRGSDEFSPAARWHSTTIDVRRTKKAFLQNGGKSRFVAAAAPAVTALIASAVADAGLAFDDAALRLVALPRLGRSVLEEAYLPVLADLISAQPVDYGRDTGHLGAGDAAANLATIHQNNLLAPGDVALLLSAGGGFSWSCLVVQAV
jgi:3-oxoacyl-[acyl-carrier-protein] synthase-3